MPSLKKLIIIADPLTQVKVATDSSLALAECGLNQNWEVFWCGAENIHVLGNDIFVSNCLQIKKANTTDISYHHTEAHIIPFSNFDFCFVRKDPPFDEQYKDLCWILSSQIKTKILNPAEMLLAFHEKALHWRALSEGFLKKENVIPTCLTSSLETIDSFCTTNASLFEKGFICKPWLGHGGEDVEFFTNKESLLKTLNKRIFHKVMIQPFLEKIHTEGDRRVLVVNGEIICSYVRLPAPGKIASNGAQGGSAVLREMTEEQKKICQGLAKFLKEKNILLAGLDVIGTQIGEINITSPTGFRIYERLSGQSVTEKAFHLLTN